MIRVPISLLQHVTVLSGTGIKSEDRGSDKVLPGRGCRIIAVFIAQPNRPLPPGVRIVCTPARHVHRTDIFIPRGGFQFWFYRFICFLVCVSIYLYYDTYISTCVNCTWSSFFYLKSIYHILLLNPSVNFRTVYVISALNGLLKCIHRSIIKTRTEHSHFTAVCLFPYSVLL
jgi:hypothetical protein